MKFEAGARFSAPYWSGSAINCSGRQYITIDGNTVGIIEATANGDLLANKVSPSYGICSTCSNFEVKNLTVRNIYVATYNYSGSRASSSTALIWTQDAGDVSIHDNIIHDADIGVLYYNNSGSAKSNISIYNNTISACNWGIGGPMAMNADLTNVSIYNNDIEIGANWEDPANNSHHNGMYTWNTGAGRLYNLNIYNNYVHDPVNPAGPFTHITGGFFVTDKITGIKIYNNVIAMTHGGQISNGYIDLWATDELSPKIYNNTFIGDGTGSGVGVQYMSQSGPGAPVIKNNIFVGMYAAIWLMGSGDTAISDYNIFYNVSDVGLRLTYPNTIYYATLSNWHAYTGQDASSIASSPALNADYKLSVGSPAKWAGTASGQLSPADKAGVTWHSPPSIGAYEYGSVRK